MLTVEKIEALLRPVLAGGEFELLDLKVLGSRGKTGFYAVIDHRHRPVGIDELTRISRQFEDALDMDESVPREYSLDVTSPGVDRSLVHEWEFAKNVGRTLTLELERAPDAAEPMLDPAAAEQSGGRSKQGRRGGGQQAETFEAELTEVRDGVLVFSGGVQIPLERVRIAKVKLPW